MLLCRRENKRGNTAQILLEDPLLLNCTVTEMPHVYRWDCFQIYDVSRHFLNNLKILVWVSHRVLDSAFWKLFLPDI